MSKILVIGSLNMDMVAKVKRIPKLGETILGDSLMLNPGGKGANQCYTVGKLGGNATMLGCVGNDSYGDMLIESLKKAEVNTSYIKKCGDIHTGTALIQIDDFGNNNIVVIKGANDKCDEGYLIDNEDVIKECDIIMLQMEIPYNAVYYAIKRGRELGKKIILNPAPAPEEFPEDILNKVDIITPNEIELEMLSKMKIKSEGDIVKGAQKLIIQGVNHVIVTIGSKGAMYVNKNGYKYFPARKVDAIDTIGAGDCFNGALAVAISEGLSLDDAISFANVAASISVTRKGAQSSIPSREEVDDILHTIKEGMPI